MSLPHPDSGPDRRENTAGLPESRFDERILHALRRIVRSVDTYSRELVVEHQVTGPQLICLNTIVEFGPITATDLARRVQLSASTVVRIVDRLEDKEFVQRERQVDDRRRVHLTATIKGLELSAKVPYSDKHPLRNALRQLPVQSQEIITALLEQVVGLMDAEELSASPVLEVGSILEAARAEQTLVDQDASEEDPASGDDTAPE